MAKKSYHIDSYFVDVNTQSYKPNKWRFAYAAIYCSRVLVSLADEIIARNTKAPFLTSILSRSPSYTALNIHLDSTTVEALRYSADELACFTQIVKKKDLVGLNRLGGVRGVAAALQTDAEKGIHGDPQEIHRRQTVFGANTYDKPPAKGFFYFVYDAFKDITILILLVCATLSLGFGIKEHGASGWYDGGSIFVAVFLVIVLSAVSNFRQSRQFEKLSKISSNIQIDVVRDGRRQKVSIFDVVVGDIVYLNIGDQIPADGIFTDGQSLQVDESSMTGESDHVEVDDSKNPFLLSGTKVADGYAHMLVTSVGRNTVWGEMMSTISRDNNERTPLQARLDKLTSSIGKMGLSVAVLVLVVLLVRYFTGNTKDENGNKEYNGSQTKFDDVMSAVIRILSDAVTIVVVAIPEGLPLAVTLTLAYSMKRMMADQAMVRKLSACETMGSATTICTDKTGTLTLNRMKVTKFYLGQESEEGGVSTIAAPILQFLHQGVGLNTTGTVYRPTTGLDPEFSGSPTEKAILSWAVLEMGMEIEELKRICSILHVETFNSEKKRSGVLIRKNDDKSIHAHWKGAAEMIVAMCPVGKRLYLETLIRPHRLILHTTPSYDIQKPYDPIV